MKLYYAPGACSMASHMVLREAGFSFDLEKVELATGKTASGEDYRRINPKGYVPALRLDDGEILTESAVILQYLADQKPAAGLAPAPGTLERYRLMEWLNFIATEMHKQLGALYNPKITPEWRENQLALFGRRCDFLEGQMGTKTYLMGDRYSVADAYLFTVLNWTHFLHVDMDKWPTLRGYMARVAERPAVRDTMRAEGLIP
ncbi:glutathione transferase GstA [Pelomicrobium sp. G1]|uniref:glutathione transferase GstA n=1 Tax=unclassified Pelomicrobium TaxID=2815318 RepID=UPI000A9E3C82